MKNTTVKREFKGIPVKEAKHELPMIIMEEDIKNAEGQQKDFGHCVFANSCARQYNADKIAIMRTVAYVSMPDGQGKKVVYRYRIPDDAREIIERFDAGEDIESGASFYLRPPKESETLDYHYKKQKETKKRRERFLQGDMTDEEERGFKKLSEINKKKGTRAAKARKENGGYDDKVETYEMDVRHGTGAVGFSRKGAK